MLVVYFCFLNFKFLILLRVYIRRGNIGRKKNKSRAERQTGGEGASAAGKRRKVFELLKLLGEKTAKSLFFTIYI